VLHGQNPFAKIPLVYGPATDRLVDMLQLAQGEILRHQLKRDGGILQLGFQSSASRHHDSIMVQVQHGQFVDGVPAAAPPLPDIGQPVARYQRIISDGDYPRSGVPVRLPESVELLEVDVRQPGLLAQRALGTVVQRLTGTDMPAGQRPWRGRTVWSI